MQEHPPLLLRMTEAAQMIGVGRSTIYELAARGEIPVVRIGRAVRVPARALEEWAESLERGQLGRDGGPR